MRWRQAFRPVERGTRRAAQALARRAGYQIVKSPGPQVHRTFPPDFDEETIRLCHRVAPFTLTGPERIAALRDSVRHLVRTGVPGAIAECGVWRGGSMQVVALTLLEEGVSDRELYLFDTFGWVPEPEGRDVDLWGTSALDDWRRYERDGDAALDPAFRYLPFDEVRKALEATGYPPERLHFVRGDVRHTIPEQAPEELALVRLDTDYYDSTLHELRHLEPRIVDGGFLLVDDYGHFKGAKDAVDEYYAAKGETVFLQRVDYTARLVSVRRNPSADI